MGKSRVIFVHNRDIGESVGEEKSSTQWSENDQISTINCNHLVDKLPVSAKDEKRNRRDNDSQVWPIGVPKNLEYAFEKTSFFRGIYPVILPLRICGLLPSRRNSPNIRGYVRFNLYMLYSIVIVLITALYFGRSLATYRSDEDFGEELFFKLQQSLWYLECFVKACSTVIAWYKTDRLAEFFRKWSLVCGDVPPKKPVRLFAICATVSSAAFVFINGCGCAFVFFGVSSLRDILATTAQPFEFDTVLKTLVVIILTVESAVAMFPVAFMCVLMYALYSEFKHVGETVSKSIQDKGEFDGDLEQLRLHHQKLCKLVEHLDQTFNIVIAVVYVTNIPNICIVLYSILYFRSHFSLALLNAFWLMFILIHMCTVSVFGAWVNSAAHSPLSDIYSIRADTLSPVKQFQINMFLSKLNGEGIGFTAFQMFVINRPTILTVVGLLLTYFVLLVQFKNSTVSTCVCSVSGLPSVLNGTSTLANGDL